MLSIAVKPEFILDCDCGLCRKVGAAWGYFESSRVTVTGTTIPFVRKDKPVPVTEIHSCLECGATTHFVHTSSFKERNPSIEQIGVNMKLFEPTELNGVEVRFANGREWSGEGPFEYRRPAMTIGADWAW